MPKPRPQSWILLTLSALMLIFLTYFAYDRLVRSPKIPATQSGEP